MVGVLWTHVELHFLSSLACDCFGHSCWDTFVASLACDGFVHNLLRCILSSLAWYEFRQNMNILNTVASEGLVNTLWEAFCGFACTWCVWSKNVEMQFVSPLAWTRILCPRWHMRRLVNTCWNAFCLLVGKLSVWSTHVNNTKKLKHMLSCILCLRRHWMCLHMICLLCPRWHYMLRCISGSEEGFSWYTFCAHAGVACVWSTLVELHFVSPPVYEGIALRMLICFLCSRRHMRGLVNTCWYSFFVLDGNGWSGDHTLSYI